MSMLLNINPGSLDPQEPFDAAVAMVTIGRPTLLRAINSVFNQTFDGTIHIVIGVDKLSGPALPLARLEGLCPHNMMVTVLDLGYSTSARHGGVHRYWGGGSLMTIVSYAANSRYVAYLDDDNWMADNHIASLRGAIDKVAWAYSYRWFVDPDTQRPLCVDEWESIGPSRGAFKAESGGWVDPNSWMLDKLKCEPALWLWCVPVPASPKRMGSDRHVFQYLMKYRRGAATGLATSFYVLNASDIMHPIRLGWIASETGLTR